MWHRLQPVGLHQFTQAASGSEALKETHRLKPALLRPPFIQRGSYFQHFLAV